MITLLPLVVAHAALAHAAPFTLEEFRPTPAHAKAVLAVRETPDATLVIRWRTGAVDDGMQYGMTRVAQHLLVQGSLREPFADLEERLYRTGATLEMTTGVRDSAIILSAPKASFDDLAARVLRMTLAPKLAEGRFADAVMRTRLDEMERSSDDSLVTYVAGNVLMMEGGKSGGEYNNPIFGDRDTLDAMGFPDVDKHIATKMNPANATVVAAGNFDPKKLKAVLATLKGGKERPLERPDIKKYLPLEFDRRSTREVHLHLQQLDIRDARGMAAAHLVAAVGQDRMFWKLRTMGLTYTPMVRPVLEEWMDFLLVVVSVNNAGATEVLPILMQTLQSLAGPTISDEEFEAARGNAIGTLERLDEQPLELALVLSSPSKVPYVSATVVDFLRRMPKADYQSLASPWLQESASIDFLFGRGRAPKKRPMNAVPDEEQKP